MMAAATAEPITFNKRPRLSGFLPVETTNHLDTNDARSGSMSADGNLMMPSNKAPQSGTSGTIGDNSSFSLATTGFVMKPLNHREHRLVP
jgi:hypothetical protein